MNDIEITVCGNVATDPRHVVSAEGVPITSFRIASTARRFDRERRSWVDGPTTWMTVTCFRALAGNVLESVRKGQKVVVYGRLRVSRWHDDEGRQRERTEVDAVAVGHDLAWGRSQFTRMSRVEPVEPPGRRAADELAEQLERDWAAPASDAPASDAPASDAPASDAPASDAPVSDAPVPAEPVSA
jgi:single-strand DNA-binding protein